MFRCSPPTSEPAEIGLGRGDLSGACASSATLGAWPAPSSLGRRRKWSRAAKWVARSEFESVTQLRRRQMELAGAELQFGCKGAPFAAAASPPPPTTTTSPTTAGLTGALLPNRSGPLLLACSALERPKSRLRRAPFKARRPTRQRRRQSRREIRSSPRGLPSAGGGRRSGPPTRRSQSASLPVCHLAGLALGSTSSGSAVLPTRERISSRRAQRRQAAVDGALGRRRRKVVWAAPEGATGRARRRARPTGGRQGELVPSEGHLSGP